MKNRFLTFLPVVILFLALLALLVFFFDMELQKVAIVCGFGVVAGTFTMVVKGGMIPPQWLFKLRQLIYGLGVGAFYLGIVLFSMTESSNYCTWKNLVVWLLLSSIVGMSMKVKYWRLCRKTQLEKREGELELSSDEVRLEKDGKYVTGRLILTNERLLFKSSKLSESNLDCAFSDENRTVELLKLFGVPIGIVLNDIKIHVAFPKWWRKRIHAL